MERPSLEFKNRSEKFSNQLPNYNRQYCSIYLARLSAMEKLLEERIRCKWGDRYPICKLHKLTEENYAKCVVIATIFKDQKLKPSILKQLAESNQLTPQPVMTHFTDESDQLFAEDELQRYHLLGNIEGKNLVTGVICAILGTDIGKGKFKVDEYIFADYQEQLERPIFENDIFVIFLSGLDFYNHHKFVSNLEMLAFWLTGMLGDIDTVSKIARIIIAGNSVRKEVSRQKPTISMISRTAESSDSIEAVASFDLFLYQLCEMIDVDVMPGENDPSNHILPQKQMHYCMFPKSTVYKSLNQVPNPYYCSLNKLAILGTSGQPVKDIMRYSEITDPLEALECCLKWNHIAPTAPDTLGCFPYYEEDPFILDDCPHVFFAGNQAEFSTKIVKGEKGQSVRLISIPEFSQTFQAVLLNLKNMDCSAVVFKEH